MIRDNVIKEYDLNLLYSNLTSNLVPWTFNHNVAYGDGKMQYGFSTNVYDDGVLENPSLSLLLNPVYKQLKVKELIRCRIGFIFYSGGEEIHDPHVDFEFPHTTSLFYVNTSSNELSQALTLLCIRYFISFASQKLFTARIFAPHFSCSNTSSHRC